MRQRLRSKLSYANVMVTILAFLVLGGGTAFGALVVTSNSEVGPDTIAGHQPARAYHANIIGGSVNGTDIANGSVKGADIGDGSVSQADIAGADVSGTMNLFPIPAHSCYQFPLTVPGAKVGDVVLLRANLPLRVMTQAMSVPQAGQVVVRACNPTQSSSSAVQGLPVRVLTLG